MRRSGTCSVVRERSKWSAARNVRPLNGTQAMIEGSQMNPFVGTWIANIEKSRRHANHQFQSATLTFEVTGDGVSMTHAGVNMSGKKESGTTVLIPDGQEHALSPQAPGVVTVTTWIGTHVLESEAKKDGRSLGKGTYAISGDGGTLTATVAGTDVAGAPFEQVIVFDRG
jgi:hypothetical protein